VDSRSEAGERVGTYDLTIRVGDCAGGPYRFSFDDTKWEIARPIPSRWFDHQAVMGSIVVRGQQHFFVADGEELMLRERAQDEFDTTACWISSE